MSVGIAIVKTEIIPISIGGYVELANKWGESGLLETSVTYGNQHGCIVRKSKKNNWCWK
jgi:hypothetical protein